MHPAARRGPEPVAQLAALGLGLNGSSEGTGIRFSLTESGLKLLKGDASGPAMFSDQEGGDFRRMHLRLKPAFLAAGRHPLTDNTVWRYSFYSPEMNLLSETELRTTTGTPLILYEYIWFNGHPVAQVDAGVVNHWTFTDHLGTPILQTDSAGNTYWRAEHEPYGKVFALRTADQHQPLRLPGQEAEQLNLGPDGVTERSYNIFRWYRNGWGRYTQPDPIMGESDTTPANPLGLGRAYLYADAAPTRLTDPLGLYAIDYGPTCKRLPMDQQWQLFQAVNAVLEKLPLGGPCALKPNQHFKIRCANCWMFGRVCGHAVPAVAFGAPLCINVDAAVNGQCGQGSDCLAATIFHEMQHKCTGWFGEKVPYACQGKFFPSCRRNDLGNPSDCRECK